MNSLALISETVGFDALWFYCNVFHLLHREVSLLKGFCMKDSACWFPAAQVA